MIFHEEFLSNTNAIPDKEVFLQTLKEEHLELKIVVGYRRFSEIIPSFKNQFEKLGRRKWPLPRDPKVPHSGRPEKSRMRVIPSPPYFEHVAHSTEYASDPWFSTFSLDSLSTLQNAEAWNNHSNIRVFNVHHSASDQNALLAYYMCDILPNAPKLCAHAKTTGLTNNTVNGNPSVAMDFELIAVEAADRNFINTTRITRPDAVKQINRLCVKQRNLQVPKSCPTNTTLHALLEKSLAMERQIVHDYHDVSPELISLLEGDQAEHKTQFWASIDKYCSADVSVIMKDPLWLECFTMLVESTTQNEVP